MTDFRIFSVAVGTALILALAGCATATPVAVEPVIPTTSAAPTVTPTPTMAPTQEPAAASCESLLDLDRLEQILTNGFDVNPAPDYIAKIRAEGSPYALFDTYGGLLCPVNNGSRVSELYGYSVITAEQQATQEARLATDGWAMTTVDGGSLYEQSSAQEGIVFAFYFRNGFWWCGYDAGVITMIVANSPQS